MRKFMSVLLCVSLLLAFPLSANASNADVYTLEEILSLNGINIDDYDDYELRDVFRSEISGARTATRNVGKAIVFTSVDGNDYTETAILVYDVNNNLVTPNMLTRGSATFNGNNVSVTVTSKYQSYYNSTEMRNFFRPYYVSAKWTTSHATATVTRFVAEYSVSGMKFAYPECVDQPDPQMLGSGTYTISKTQSNPTKGQLYSKTSYPSYALSVVGSPMYGGSISIDVTTNTGSWGDSIGAQPLG